MTQPNDTDRSKFPTIACTRCGGGGRYSYNAMHGDMCYGCSGSGVQYSRKVAPIAAEYQAAVRALRRPVVSCLLADDVIIDSLSDRSRAGDHWVRVLAIEITDECCGWSGAEKTPTSWYHLITLAASPGYPDRVMPLKLSGNQIVRRNGNVDIAPYLERAWATTQLARLETA